ncbi:MAG: hypothetical protein Ct9H90mP25_3670 [Gammaproteobacteria bacterium]|nr:MAG: hypothetical protein Ct9H90mP25_3670 [Gammaproteobacteria bacterium]
MVGPKIIQNIARPCAKKNGIISKLNQNKKLKKKFFRLLIVSVFFVSSLLQLQGGGTRELFGEYKLAAEDYLRI